MIRLVTFVISLLLFYACKQRTTTNAEKISKDVLYENIDSTVKPGDDFFQYANGGWMKRTTIPGAEGGWGIGNMVQDDIYIKLRKINETAVTDTKALGQDKKIGDFWKAGMDSAAIDKAGLTPLQPYFAKIDSMQTAKDITSLLVEMHKMGISAGFEMYVAQDDKKSDEYALIFGQGGLGLPNRDYYFNTDARTVSIREGYKQYAAETIKKWDTSHTTKTADLVFELQKKLAASSRKLADLRDPYKNYNKMSWSALQQLSPAIDWSYFKSNTGADKVDSVIVGQPEFYKALSTAISSTPINTWKHYLKLALVQSNAAYLDTTNFNAYFKFSKLLSGATQPKDRWKRVLDAEENAMGEMLGQLFVKEYFTPEAKVRYTTMVENVRTAFRERLEKLSWMSDSTKQRAYLKLEKVSKKVGYPDKWKDFSSLQITGSSWVENMLSAGRFWTNYQMNKLGKPVDRNEWAMTPQTYNAYYNPSNNEMVLPAGIFAVPGFMDAQLDDALVYGYAAASTIGHELTHGFDDQGRQYDEMGNLKNWWTPADEKQFSNRAAGIIKQFNGYSPVDTFHVNGQATQGENIADLGGMVLGLDAFKKTEAYKSGEKINGFTPLQRYFLGYALGWQYMVRKENLARRILTDVHAPAKERVNGPVVNVPEWYEAFNVQPGDKMYVPDSLRVKIW